MARSYARVRALNDSAVFISLCAENEALAEARKLAEQGRTDLPLYGIPVAVKDNIDALGLPTTAACPAFSYRPGRDATAVARLREAGAVIIGKTNLDQFATGLVGLRSPYGAPRNSLDPALVPGGSSSGSAVAVATGIVPVALGTDTAGSGRVPALLNNIIGLKPSLGLVSNAGLVPACRTLDCVSVFALTTDDASMVLSVISGYDAKDPFCRRRPLSAPGALPAPIRIGVPRPGQRVFFGDQRSAAAFMPICALDRLVRTRGVHRRDRHRAVLRGGAAVVRRSLGRGTLYRGALADRVIARIHASGNARDHPGRRTHQRGRCLRRFLSARSIASRRTRDLRTYRRASAADGADPLYRRAGARRSDSAQQPARHLHQLRQPARSVRTGRSRRAP